MKRFSKRSKRGFTLIEIMIVVLIIAVLLAIAIPNFMKARDTSRTKACVANLRQIESAQMQWAMDKKEAGTATVTMTDICPDYIKDTPTCPCGGNYVLTTVDANPTCPNVGTYPEHTIQ